MTLRNLPAVSTTSTESGLVAQSNFVNLFYGQDILPEFGSTRFNPSFAQRCLSYASETNHSNRFFTFIELMLAVP